MYSHGHSVIFPGSLTRDFYVGVAYAAVSGCFIPETWTFLTNTDHLFVSIASSFSLILFLSFFLQASVYVILCLSPQYISHIVKCLSKCINYYYLCTYVIDVQSMYFFQSELKSSLLYPSVYISCMYAVIDNSWRMFWLVNLRFFFLVLPYRLYTVDGWRFENHTNLYYLLLGLFSVYYFFPFLSFFFFFFLGGV